jgi:hypothetical protein
VLGQVDDKENTMRLRIAIFIVGIVVLGAAMITSLVLRNGNFVDECTAKGGVPFQPRDAHICLNPDAVIKLK